MSSVERLPPEILADIFCCCPREHSTYDLSSTIWTVGRVCRTWREVSITTAQIWTSIYIKLDELAHREEAGCIDMLRAVLERTSGLPLHIHFIFPKYRLKDHYQKVVDVVRKESHRWVSLKYDASSFMAYSTDSFSMNHPMPTIYPAQNFEPKSLPILREVEISTKFQSQTADYRLFRAVGGSPVLEKLILSNLDFSNIQEVMPAIPWGQLKYLGILAGDNPLPVPLAILTGILQRCSSLENLVVDQCPWETRPEESPGPPTLSTLRSLEIQRNPHWGNDLIRASIDLSHIAIVPALDHLGLSNFDLYQEIDPFIRAIEDSSPELRSVSLRDIALSDITVERFLRAVGSNLRILTLQGQVFGHLFDYIASDYQGTFLPKLEKLVVKLDGSTVISPPLDAVIKAVRARVSPPDGTCKLKAVEVDVYAEEAGIGLVEELEAINNHKLQIEVHRIEAPYHDGTEVNRIVRLGKFLNTTFFGQHWDLAGDLINLHENMPMLDTVFKILENCSSEVYEDRSNIHSLAKLRQVLEKFFKGKDAIPKNYDLAKRAERLLDDRFGWNPNGRKRHLHPAPLVYRFTDLEVGEHYPTVRGLLPRMRDGNTALK